MNLIAPPWKTVPMGQPHGSSEHFKAEKKKMESLDKTQKHFLDELTLPKSQTKEVFSACSLWADTITVPVWDPFWGEPKREGERKRRGHEEAVGPTECVSH